MNRSQRARLAEETLRILEDGAYTAPSGRPVSIADAMATARSARRTYRPDDPIEPTTGDHPTEVIVENETTLEGARHLTDQGEAPAILNFASAKNPGGGFKSGSQAQEESLARASGLFPLLDGNEMYVVNRQRRDAVYTDHVVYTPGVPVFRTDAGTLLERPFLVDVVSAPAVNAGALLARAPDREAEIEPVMRRRVRRVLGAIRDHGRDVAVLGAWGCGVFRNRPELVAELFAEALSGPFRGAFRTVRFSVLDTTDQQVVLRPFESALRRLSLP